MKVRILGTGCPKCRTLYGLATEAIRDSGVDAELEKVEKLADIMGYGVMMTPALVIDDQVMSSGRLPSVSQIIEWLREKGNA